MSETTLAVVMFGVLVALIALRMPIAIAMFTVGAIGLGLLDDFSRVLVFIETAPVGRTTSYSLSVIPIFLLMGNLAMRSGISRELFESVRTWVGHRPGGIAVATIGGCAFFGAICGSSVATGATMASVALPEMRRFGYSGALATGCLAAGGTLGILIPPSIILVIYAIITEQSIGDLFLAAILPGVVATLYYMVAVWAFVRTNPEAGPPGPRHSWPERIRSLRFVWPVIVIFLIVVVGIYDGWFTPTEGAAVGVASTALIAVARRITWLDFLACLTDTAKTTGMIYLILIGAELYGSFLAFSELPANFASAIGGLDLAPLTVVLAIMLAYILLGTVMDGIAMILITVPVFLPAVLALDLGMSATAATVWFGILVLCVVETGQITPPVGLNVYVINAMAEGVSLSETFVGITPFFVSDLFRIATIMAFPALTLWLPGLS